MMLSFLAAERRKTVATAEGRGFSFGPRKPQSGVRFFRRSAALLAQQFKTTALLAASRWRARASRSRGYNLSPLRGSMRMRFARLSKICRLII